LSLPVWDEAVNTERETADKVQRMSECETDGLLREAIALQGFEERRHATLLDLFTARYDIPVERRTDPDGAEDPAWAFLRTEYGECFDAFFAFGLFAFARESGFFPPPLVALFDPIMQEEARHILFFVNWLAYRRRSGCSTGARCSTSAGLRLALQILNRIRTRVRPWRAREDNFTMTVTPWLATSIRSFLETCVQENDRRLGAYDPDLLRPAFAPRWRARRCACCRAEAAGAQAASASAVLLNSSRSPR
jgi:hypothetical protein